jgi:hypothetical protein
LHKVSTYKSKRQGQVPRLSDIKIPISPISPSHFVKFYIPSVEDLFWIGDRILKMDNTRLRACLMSWRACQDDGLELRWQLHSTNEQCFTFLPSKVVILNLIQE